MPLIDFRRQWQEIREDATRVFEEVGASGWYILGREVSSFEEKLAGSWGLGHATGVGNGLDAIEIALRALDIRPGERVLTTPLSAFATTLAIVRCDAVPVFVDTDRHGLLDLAVLTPDGFAEWVEVAATVLTGGGDGSNMDRRQARDVTVRAAEPQLCQLDGDVFCEATEIRFVVDPGALTVRVPAQ